MHHVTFLQYLLHVERRRQLNLYSGFWEPSLPIPLNVALAQHLSSNACERNNICSCCQTMCIGPSTHIVATTCCICFKKCIDGQRLPTPMPSNPVR